MCRTLASMAEGSSTASSFIACEAVKGRPTVACDTPTPRDEGVSPFIRTAVVGTCQTSIGDKQTNKHHVKRCHPPMKDATRGERPCRPQREDRRKAWSKPSLACIKFEILTLGAGGATKPQRIWSCFSFSAASRRCVRSFLRSFFVSGRGCGGGAGGSAGGSICTCEDMK